MKKFGSRLFVLVLGVLLAAPVTAQSDEDFAHLIQEIEAEASDLTGAAIVIIKDDKVVYKKVFGRHKDGTPFDARTLFGLASVSKPIVATALSALVQKDKASFEDTVVYQGLKIPLIQVLSHTSGYPIRGDKEIEKGLSRDALLGFLKKSKRTLRKGEKPYFYSNLVYSLSQEYAASKGYTLKALLGVLGVGFETLPLSSTNIALPHSREKKPLPFPSLYQQNVAASGGVFASLDTMIQFLHIAIGKKPELVSRASLNTLFSPRARAGDVFHWHRIPFKDQDIISSYGLGWRRLRLKSRPGADLIFHSGSINGTTAFVGMTQDGRMGAAILANQSTGFPLKAGLSIWKNYMQ
ncbi:MAG: beta-lactamase family protein [Proteobacteria bacterium]|nr:beta-lactamase family protein [Pseudomonadota bacterium]